MTFIRVVVWLALLAVLPLTTRAEEYHRETGHAYLDESYWDENGVLHIVISAVAVDQWLSGGGTGNVINPDDSSAQKPQEAATSQQTEAVLTTTPVPQSAPYWVIEETASDVVISGMGRVLTAPIVLDSPITYYDFYCEYGALQVDCIQGLQVARQLLSKPALEDAPREGSDSFNSSGSPAYRLLVQADGPWSLHFNAAHALYPETVTYKTDEEE